MRQRTMLSFAAGLALALITMLAAGSQRAIAQQDPNCCDYIINASHIPAACFPLAVTTTWAGGLSATVTLPTPSFYSFHVPFACPPAPAFLAATVTSAGVFCCIRPISFFCGGCLFIELRPC